MTIADSFEEPDMPPENIAAMDAMLTSAPLAWPDAKPTVPGWYWWERSPTAGDEIVQVTIGVRLVADIGGRYHPISELPGRWAGPIPHPADAIASASPAS